MEFLRRRLGLIFRILVSALLIGWLVRFVDWGQFITILRKVDVRWLVAAFFCFSPVLIIVSWRWRMLLSVHGVHLRFWRVFELTMIGQFFSAFLVGTTGGDVIKIFYAARAVPSKKAAVAFTVIVDRAIGLVALLIFGTALSFTQLPLLLSHKDTHAATVVFYLFAVGGVTASALACIGPFVMQHRALRALVKRLPLIHRITPLFEAYEHTARALGTNIIALIGSIPSHICITLMGYCILCAMHLHPPLLAFCAILAMVNMLIALPVSFAGLGVREGLFIMFFALFNIDKNQALAYSITYFGLNLLWSLSGGLFYFLYRHETHTPPPDVTEVEPLFTDR